jgi:hypothetical protein
MDLKVGLQLNWNSRLKMFVTQSQTDRWMSVAYLIWAVEADLQKDCV